MQIEVTAKKVEDAIAQGLKELNATMEEVDIKVVDAGGLFRKAKVVLTLEREEQTAKEPEQKPEKSEKPEQKSEQKLEKSEHKQPKKAVKESEPKQDKKPEQKPAPDPEPSKPSKKQADRQKKQPERQNVEPDPETIARRAEEDKLACEQSLKFVSDIIRLMGFEVTSEIENGMIELTAPEGDDSLLIGRHGETLSALSYLAETAIRAEKKHATVTVDCNGYRERRAASLSAMARRRANECVAKHRRIKLEPMERIDRRTVHNALTDDNRVTTVSEGKEPYRYIVIAPKK